MSGVAEALARLESEGRLVKRHRGASEESIRRVTAKLGMELPADYLALLREANGLSANGEGTWLDLIPLEEVPRHREVSLEVGDPTLLVFASDGSREYFCFDLSLPGWPVVMATFGVRTLAPPIPCADSASAFLEKVAHGFDPFEGSEG